MKGGTLFSGIGAPECAAPWIDWRWCAEIEAFPSAVHAARFPSVPNLGDVTKVNWDAVEPVDVLVAGSPCQSFSVAGKRLGLDDPRGNLALVTIDVARRVRADWLVFENVPGLLSSAGGWDFGSFLGTLAEHGFDAVWRVLDAQFFGVAQRRRRLFLVASAGGWANPAPVLLEPDSLQGNPAPRREAGQSPSPTLSARTKGGGGLGTDFDCDGGLIASTGQVSHCLNAGGMGRQDYETETLLTFGWQNSASQGDSVDEHITPTLDKSKTPAVAFDLRGREDGAQFEGPHDTANIRAASGGSSRSYVAGSAVRRLTPTECERLQGFPEASEKIWIAVCLEDKCLPSVTAAARCTTGQNSALNAGEGESLQTAQNAVQCFCTNHQDRALPVALHVLLNAERGEVEIRNAGKLIWSASTAEPSSASPLPMPTADFARLVALTTQTAAKQTRAGKAGLQQSTEPSTHPWNGAAFVSLSGREIAEHAEDVQQYIGTGNLPSTFTTSPSTQSTLDCDLILRILSCCVLSATASCIPAVTSSGNSFSLEVETRCGWTAITYRNKPAADGPRYKAIGNSMPVPVMEWILNRLRLVDAAARKEAA